MIMEKIIVLLFAFLVYGSSFAQPGKKPPQKDKPPTQKEMEDMMKQMQKELDGMSPEDKRMMDSMGIKLPSTRDIPKLSDKQWADALEDENRVVPKRDAARIAAIPKPVMDAKMGAYLAAIQKKVSATSKPEVLGMAKKIDSYFQALSKTPAETGNMCMAFWIAGKPQMALYLMGETCVMTPNNFDNLSNYAAMLSMQGAQHLAIPILNNLNTKFPKNSTLLNNLGQAWFGLGEITKAEKYLDSAIRIYAYHPQANFSKALIEESKGNTKKAVELVKKSIKHSYSKEKEEKLKQLGYKLLLDDVYIPFKPGPDPLGLGSTHRPDYPKTLDELKTLKTAWKNFNNDCDNRILQLQKQLNEAAQKYSTDLTKLASQVRKDYTSVSNVSTLVKEPLFIKKGSLAMSKATEFYETQFKQLKAMRVKLAADLSEIQKHHKRAAPEAPCDAHRDAENDFLKSYNDTKQTADEAALKLFKQYYNELAYWSQYTSTDANQFEIIRLQFLIDWLMKNKEYQPLLYSEFEELECLEPEEAEEGKLSEFDVIACKYKSKLKFLMITIESNCSRMTSEFDFMFLKYVRKDDFERAEGDTYIASTITVSAEAGKALEAGPLKVEAKLGAGVELEFSRTGLEDVTLIAEAKVGAGTNIFDENEETGSPGIGLAGKDAFPTTEEVGVEGRISLISGHGSLSTNSSIDALKGIRLANW
jgi:tetratricopeptide (TPR) repeat protein